LERIEKFKLSFPVGHSADAEKISSITGAYTNESPRYLQTTDFLLDPDGKILNAQRGLFQRSNRQVGRRGCYRYGEISQIEVLRLGESETLTKSESWHEDREFRDSVKSAETIANSMGFLFDSHRPLQILWKQINDDDTGAPVGLHLILEAIP
jgi:hypothetical protein